MDAVLLIARLLLAVVFAVAGVAKLADLAGSRTAVAGFGVPERLAAPLGTILPFAEMAIAVLLVPAATATAAGIAALALLFLFSLGIAASMARGEAPDCHCFGQLHSEPAGPRTLVRNLLLAGVAALVLAVGAGGQPGLGAVDGGTWAIIGGVLVLALLAAAGANTLLSLLRRNGQLLQRVEDLEAELVAHGIPVPDASSQDEHGLPVGSEAPAFELAGIDGPPVSLDTLLSPGRPTLLVFTAAGCGPCETLMPKVAGWQRAHAAELTVAIVAEGDRSEVTTKLAEHDLDNVLLQREMDVADRYEAFATPSAVLVGADGLIASRLAAGGDSISALVAESTGSPPRLEVVRAS